MNKNVITRVIIILAAFVAGYVIVTNISTPTVGTDKGDRAPDFTLPMYNGEELSLSSYEDNIVIMNMWASWCEPCTREIPDLMKFHKAYETEGVQVVTINMNSYERNREDSEKFVAEYDMTQTPAFIDEEGEVADLYNIQALPTTYVLDEDGMIIEKIVRETTFEELEQIIEELL